MESPHDLHSSQVTCLAAGLAHDSVSAELPLSTTSEDDPGSESVVLSSSPETLHCASKKGLCIVTTIGCLCKEELTFPFSFALKNGRQEDS